MASDKLMNHTQGEDIISNLDTIAQSLENLSAVSPAKFGMGYAVTNTPADTAAKTANIANFTLTEGAPVNVKFTYANTATNATLNLNNTGAKPILYKGDPITTDIISAGDICTFIYSSANGGSYNIINIDALSGAGAGTVKSVGASTGLKTDQTGGAAINMTGSVKLDLKSETPFEGSASAPVEIEDKIYPVALDADGHPAVSVPGTEYTSGAGIDISEDNEITNTGVFDVATPTSSDITATDGDIKVTKKVVNSGVTSDSVTFVKPKGINDPAFKALDSSTSGLTTDDDHVPTSKTVQDAIDTALASASIYKGTIAAFNDLPTSTATVIVRKGWYYRVSTAWSATTGTPATDVGDIIIAEIDSPSKSIDGTNWSLLHNEANTDANVAQSPVSTNAEYEVLFSGSADNTAHTEGTGKDSGLTYNPSTNKLTVSGEVSASSYSGLPEGNTTTKGIVQLGTDSDKAASGSHGHGNITNGGALQTTDVSIASEDKLVITDASDSNKVARSSVSFDGSTATQALTKKGTWETFNNYTHPDTAGNKHIPENGATGNYLKYGGSSGTASWAAPLTEWPTTPTHMDTLPSTKLLDDRFKTNESDINILKTSMDNLFRTPVFGFRINKNESNSSTAVEYLYDAVGMTPAYMDFTNSTFNYGSWGDAWFVKNNKPVALNFDGTEAFELDPTNWWKKSDGTTDSGIENSSGNYNFMSRFPLVYINRWEDENYNYVAISERPVTPNFLAQAHTGLNGTINSNIYLPMFKGWIDGSTGGTISSTGKLRSLAGKWPSCGTDATEEFNAIKNITGSATSGWQLFAHSQYCLLNDLLTLISKSIDVKACFGRGDISTYSSSDSTVRDGSKTGYANNGKYISGYEGYASGTTTKSTCGQFFGYDDTTHHVTAFFVQDPWGNRWDRSPGLNRINRAYKVKMTPPYSINSDSSYITAGIQTPSSEGWLRKISSSNAYGHLPFAVGDGAADTKNKYFWSYFYTNSTTDEKLSLVGGNCSNGGSCSSRFVYLYHASSHRSWSIGGSPCYVSP